MQTIPSWIHVHEKLESGAEIVKSSNSNHTSDKRKCGAAAVGKFGVTGASMTNEYMHVCNGKGGFQSDDSHVLL